VSELTVSQALGAWVDDFDLDSVPASAREAARKTLVNTVGTAIGAYGLDDAGLAVDAVTAEGISGPSTVLAGGEKLPAMQAVYLNGILTCNLGQEETHITSGTHPAETTIPVVLSLAERLGSTGPEVLAAILVGIEVTVRVASMDLTPAVKFDNCEAPAVYGTTGAAAAAAKLARLDRAGIVNAIGLGANLAAGLSEPVKFGSTEYHFTVGASPMHGLMAYELARQGGVAADTVFEGDGGFYQLFGAADRADLAEHDCVADVMETLGEVWEIEELIYKPYPVNFFNQSPIDGAAGIRSRNGLTAEDVKSVRLEIGELAAASGGPNRQPYSSRGGVLGATGYCVASMLARGAVGLRETTDYEASDILGILDKTEIVPVEGLMTARIKVETSSGDVYEFDHDEDGRDYRLDMGEIEEIAREAAANVLSDEEADRLVGALSAVEGTEDFAEIMKLTVKG